LEDHQRFYLGSDMMEYIAGMNYSIRLELDNLLDCPLKSGINHLLYPVLPMLIQATIAGKAQMRVCKMNNLQGLRSLLEERLESSTMDKALILFFLSQDAQIVLIAVNPCRHWERNV